MLANVAYEDIYEIAVLQSVLSAAIAVGVLCIGVRTVGRIYARVAIANFITDVRDLNTTGFLKKTENLKDVHVHNNRGVVTYIIVKAHGKGVGMQASRKRAVLNTTVLLTCVLVLAQGVFTKMGRKIHKTGDGVHINIERNITDVYAFNVVFQAIRSVKEKKPV